MTRPLILVTNDDGIHAPGLAVLADVLDDLGEVWVYAPDRNQSAVGHGISLHRPLRVQEVRKRWYSVDGTPTDCVLLAVRNLLERRPSLVVSGINNGPNMGDDVTYSGTVAGAYEGMLLGIPSLAFSNQCVQPLHWESAGAVAKQLATFVLNHGLPEDTVLNVNIPDSPLGEIRGVRATRMGRRAYVDDIVHRTDPRGVSYYWISGEEPRQVSGEGTDFEALDQGCVSVTPLHRDLTNFQALESVKSHSSFADLSANLDALEVKP